SFSSATVTLIPGFPVQGTPTVTPAPLCAPSPSREAGDCLPGSAGFWVPAPMAQRRNAATSAAPAILRRRDRLLILLSLFLSFLVSIQGSPRPHSLLDGAMLRNSDPSWKQVFVRPPFRLARTALSHVLLPAANSLFPVSTRGSEAIPGIRALLF